MPISAKVSPFSFFAFNNNCVDSGNDIEKVNNVNDLSNENDLLDRWLINMIIFRLFQLK